MTSQGSWTGSGPFPAFSPRLGMGEGAPGGPNGPPVVGGGGGSCDGGLAESKGPKTLGPSEGSGSRKSGPSGAEGASVGIAATSAAGLDGTLGASAGSVAGGIAGACAFAVEGAWTRARARARNATIGQGLDQDRGSAADPRTGSMDRERLVIREPRHRCDFALGPMAATASYRMTE
jgi:hypothetical protein